MSDFLKVGPDIYNIRWIKKIWCTNDECEIKVANTRSKRDKTDHYESSYNDEIVSVLKKNDNEGYMRVKKFYDKITNKCN